MATPPTLSRPGVKVYTDFRTASVTPIVPQLPACVMGIAKEVIEAVANDGTLNSSALIALPARLEFPYVAATYAIGTLTLKLSVNNGPEQTLTFPLTTPSVAEVKAYIDGLAIPGLLCDIEESGTDQRIVLRTSLTGPYATLAVTGGTGLIVLDLHSGGYKEVGRGGYNSFFGTNFALPNYPDPRGNLDELVIDYSTVRVFLGTGGGGYTEVSSTASYLRGATAAVSVYDDSDGDNLSPYLTFAGQNFTDGAAVLTGSVDLTVAPAALNGSSAIFSMDGGAPVTVNFAANVTAADVIADINTAFGFTVATLDASNFLALTSTSSGVDSTFERTGGTALLANLGLAVGAHADGRVSRARRQGTVDLSGLTYGGAGPFASGLSLIMSLDGEPEQTLVIDSTFTSAADIVTAINLIWQRKGAGSEVIASLNGANQLVLRSPNVQGGDESCIRINALGTATTVIGLTATRVGGNPYAPAIGDAVYGDGIYLGLITEVAPAGVVTRLRLDTEFLLTKTCVNFYIEAQDLGMQSATRPSADLTVDSTSGEVVLKAERMRSPAGVPSAAVDLGIYLAYTALRQDVSAVGTNSNLLRISSLTGLETDLSPVNTENPLALGLYFALLNAPGLECYGLGVSATSVDEPYGTLDAWATAFEFIESKDVYAISPLTHAIEVADLADAHVTAMSDPEVGLERCVFFNPTRPTRVANTLIGSGALGNSTGGVSTFDTGIANLAALLATAGFPAPPYDIDDRIFLRMDNDTNNYLITSVSGSIVTVNTAALAAGTSEDNTDGFYYDGGSPAFVDPIVDRPFSVFVRGAVLANLTEEAIAYAAIPSGYLNRRMVFITPDKAKATIDGLEQEIEGFYLCAALAGKTASKLPSDPLTEVGVKGFSGLKGATDRYGEIQYRIMDGGGLWSLYQESAGQPVKTRHQLTSDMSSIEKREFSILTALDFTAKFLRGGLRNFIGRFNITANLQSSISTAVDGLGSFLTSQQVLDAFSVSRLIQNPDQPDSLILDINVKVLYPCNEIRITLIV